MERDELAGWLRLALSLPQDGAAARRLLAAFGLPSSIFAQDRGALALVVDRAAADALAQEPPDLAQRLDATLDWLAEDPAHRQVLTLGDPDYPRALLAIEDPPLMLYRLGVLQAPPARSLAIVGSRNPTPQGLQNARRFARAFAEARVTVVSGLALGIDGAAHQGALDGAAQDAIATIAVVGTGLDRVYPRQHLELAHAIAGRGQIVSEYPLGTPPLPHNFPRRNRLIAALSQGTLVVEAALQSGSLITARLASEQGKEVFAIPGSIHSPQSRGCHVLLRQGAKLVESAQDVLEDLRLVLPGPPAPTPPEEAEGEGSALLEALGHDPVGLDALIARTGIPAPLLQAQLLELELAGQVARLPGGLFQRLGKA
ncbi:DNA-protecting protein DprA [Ramlibacter sp. USB13]|uniref:DNA-protecting protein DprA n=1 Tax=Ramlibacter cellulosilyticus TaxID=2764187 RepID=A0A923SAI7_9BURK|nr:DNA-processing protein DprA [Ramlibacter cellulosilyticus]MBC5782831.1 DNA-protecting protein DprA [Ramlibacter cellulosilyticus]